MEISNGGILHVNSIGFTPYSGGGICLLTDDRDVMKILELYEK